MKYYETMEFRAFFHGWGIPVYGLTETVQQRLQLSPDAVDDALNRPSWNLIDEPKAVEDEI
jgi:hypothetical protein